MTTQLSPHFTLEEMIRSTTATRLGIDNTPGADPYTKGMTREIIIENLRHLCVTVLEPAREIVGPLWIESGYRCKRLNTEQRGAQDSFHMLGLAADAHPLKYSTADAAEMIVNSGVKFDQLILERYMPGFPLSGWLHLGAARLLDAPRRSVLTSPDGVHYLEGLHP
jgi:hypothetical protein